MLQLEVTSRFDLERPVLIALVAVMHFVADADDPTGILARLAGRLPGGSVLVFSHVCASGVDPQALAGMTAGYRKSSSDIEFRAEPTIGAMLGEAGWQVVAPGLRDVQQWAPPGHSYQGEQAASV